jgi:hypothetical protein
MQIKKISLIRSDSSKTRRKGKLIASHETDIIVSLTLNSNAVVSSGSVLRALNKENGPKRFAQSSYGFLRREPYQPLIFKAHSHTSPKKDHVDGELYVDVINYFMRKASPASKTELISKHN